MFSGFYVKLTEPNRNRSVWTGSGLNFSIKIFFDYFLDKNQTENDHP